MKLVREQLYEKFVEDSDVMSDMGIGMKCKIEKALKELIKTLSKKHFINNLKISPDGNEIMIKLSRNMRYTSVSQKMIKGWIDEQLQNSILRDCLIYPKKFKREFSWKENEYGGMFKHTYIIKVKSEYYNLFKDLHNKILI